MPNPLDIYSSFQRCLQAQDYEHLGDVVDLQGYTENCLGLTGWTTGFEVALQNWSRNILAAFSDLEFSTEDVIEGGDSVVVRARVEGTHIGSFRWRSDHLPEPYALRRTAEWSQPYPGLAVSFPRAQGLFHSNTCKGCST